MFHQKPRNKKIIDFRKTTQSIVWEYFFFLHLLLLIDAHE